MASEPQMRVRITVAPGDVRQFDNWGPKTIPFRESDLIERTYGKPFGRFMADLKQDSMYATRILAWSLLKRDNRGLKMEDLLDMMIGDIEVEIVCSECAQVLDLRLVWGSKQRPPVNFQEGDPSRLDLVHDDGRKDCDIDEQDPTQAEGQAPSALPDSAESPNGETDTSPTLPTFSESDPGSGTLSPTTAD